MLLHLISSHLCYARSNYVKKIGLLLFVQVGCFKRCLLHSKYQVFQHFLKLEEICVELKAMKAKMEIRFLSLKRSFSGTMRSQQKKTPLDLFEEGVCYRQQLIWSSITGILNEKITLNKLATRIDGFNSTQLSADIN